MPLEIHPNTGNKRMSKIVNTQKSNSVP